MDQLAQIEFNATPARYTMKDNNPPLGAPVLERDKCSLYWMGGVMDCLSTVWALFKNEKYEEPQDDDDWFIPYEHITDMVYLGSGAQGIVFGGTLKGEMVAIKKLRDKSDPNIKHLRKLNHENIVRFRGICTGTAQIPCLIMEYCQYGPLFDFLHSGVTFNPKQTVRWARDIALGMSYLHSHKIIHRDLKSPNVLIADNLVAKVSDFGTSREWNDVSAIMSFAGTVAWMAPEVIRHDLCSERIDVWSYGVVLWELLTQEVPYKNLETHAIMWGVGTDTIALPVPSTCPSSIKLLLNQCWNRVSRNRPPFKIIAAHLDMAGEDLCALDQDTFNKTQMIWREEVKISMENLYAKGDKPVTVDRIIQRQNYLKQARNVRLVYEQQLSRANELFMEVCSIRLQLEQREQILAEKEIALDGCRCGIRKKFRYFQRQTSSSSDGLKVALAAISENRRKKKKQAMSSPAQMIVNYVKDKPNETPTVTTTVDGCVACACDESIQNNNVTALETVKDTVIESNGNVIVQETGCNNEIPVNDNYVSELGHV